MKFLLLGQREGALNKISTAIECDPSPAEFHVLRCVCVCVCLCVSVCVCGVCVSVCVCVCV